MRLWASSRTPLCELGLQRSSPGHVYIPEAQTVPFDQPDLQSDELWSQNLYNIVIWAPGHPANILTHVNKALAEVDPNLVIHDVHIRE